jgi:hypothetical protein
MWPGKAAVVVSVVHIIKAVTEGPFALDGHEVLLITAYLFHAGGHESPASLLANKAKSFIGNVVLGMGFTFDDTDKKGIATPLAEMRRLIAQSSANAERIFPFLGGEELNNSPTQSHHRYVINFEDWPLQREGGGSLWAGASTDTKKQWLKSGNVPADYPGPVASDFPDLLSIVVKNVKPEREKGNRDKYRRLWWQFAERAVDLTALITRQGIKRVLAVNCGATPHLAVAFLPSGQVFSHTLALFPFESAAAFAVLQSRIHEAWARLQGSSMKDDLRYTPSDCFGTFPMPIDFELKSSLEEAGAALHAYRAEIMRRESKGLTATYNRFHNPSDMNPQMVQLRQLHDAIDRAVLGEYGWSDINPVCEFCSEFEESVQEDSESGRTRPKRYRYRWPDEIRDEVLARLLELNRSRAEEETQSTSGAAAKKSAGKRGRKSSKSTPAASPSLFEVEEPSE